MFSNISRQVARNLGSYQKKLVTQPAFRFQKINVNSKLSKYATEYQKLQSLCN
jgi:cell fate (sporulation/competence/biofilm development) regulator YlbF (YheA/YmcA/DUF963 family)